MVLTTIRNHKTRKD